MFHTGMYKFRVIDDASNEDVEAYHMLYPWFVELLDRQDIERLIIELSEV